MKLFWIPRYLIVMLLICSSISIYPQFSSAKTKCDSKQLAFLNFEEKINIMFSANAKQLDMLNKLDKFNEQMDEETIYRIILSTKKTFAETSNNFTKLEIPSILPKNIKTSLKIIKGDFSFGFKTLEESMNDYAQYLETKDPILFWKSVKKRDKGIAYINGGFTSLTSTRLQLISPEFKENFNTAWEVIQIYLYKLQRT